MEVDHLSRSRYCRWGGFETNVNFACFDGIFHLVMDRRSVKRRSKRPTSALIHRQWIKWHFVFFNSSLTVNFLKQIQVKFSEIL